MTTWIYDAEWKVPEGADVVMGAEKIWCVCFKKLNEEVWVEFTQDNLLELNEFFTQEDATYVAHNQLGADLIVLSRFLGFDYTVGPDTIMSKKCRFIDTYDWSMRLNPDRPMAFYKGKGVGQHGLKAWGVRLGILKPEVEDWTDQPIEVYLNRCRADTLINEKTYIHLLNELGKERG